jgi:hypothetical protein
MEATVRSLVALGFALILIMLRLEANRFGAAEYDEPIGGRGRPLLIRISWYAMGLAGIVLILLVDPAPGLELHLTVGDPTEAIVLGIILASAGAAQSVALALLHYRHLRLPPSEQYPGAIANELLTAFLDEAIFRGAVLGFLLLAGFGTALAIVTQAIVYTLATRLGAPGRDRYMFALSFFVGLAGGWATLATGGIGAAFLGHAVTRVGVFLTTGHSGQPAPSGKELEDLERRRRMPEGWRAVGRDGARESGRDR